MVQYDQRMQGGAAPYPAPSQMSIIPMSRWKNSFLWSVPANTFEILQGYYISLICYKADLDGQKIKVAVNGSKLSPINSALATKRKYTCIPGHPELVGVALALGPGSYYATCDPDAHPFMIYNYGFRAIDPDRDLGDFCGDDHFFGYALPVGYTFKSDSGALTITVDTLCGKWHVKVHDGRKQNAGIKSIQIMDDRNGDILRPPQVYHNVQFDPNNPDVNPDNLLEIDLQGSDTTYEFDVLVSNPLDTAGAYGPVYILDNIGNGYLVKLYYRAPKLLYTATPNWLSSTSDSLVFPVTLPGNDTCATIKYYNAGKKGDPSFQITGSKIKKGNPYFKITSTNPNLPTNLSPGDTLYVNVCFHSKDTLVHLDSIITSTTCFDAPITLVGPGGTPLIYATDRDFGQVVIGDEKCDTVTIRNIGTIPFTLTDQNLKDIVNFKFDPTSTLNTVKLPHVLKPGDFVRLSFCFHPTVLGPDTTISTWLTDMSGDFKDSIKSWSRLSGVGIKPGVIWDRPKQTDSTVCDSAIVNRVWLYNKNKGATTIYDISFHGPDADEYSMVTNQLTYNPLADSTHLLVMQPGDSFWVDYKFAPKLSKVPMFRDRKASFVCAFYINSTFTNNDSTVIDMTGEIRYPALKVEPPVTDFGVMGIGQLVTQTIALIDTGNAPYILSSANFPNPPVVSMINVATGLNIGPGDTIKVGDTVLVQVGYKNMIPGRDTVTAKFSGTADCANQPAPKITGDPESTKLQTIDWVAPDTYINCRNSQDVKSIAVLNAGFSQWNLDSIKFVTTDPDTLKQFDMLDKTGKLTHALYPNIKVSSGDTIYVPGEFHPTLIGSSTVEIAFYLDSAGQTKKVLFAYMTGIGKGEHTVISAANPDANAQIPGQYVATTGNPLAVTNRFTGTNIHAAAGATEVIYTLTYRRDLFQLDQKTGNNGFSAANGYTGRVVGNPVDDPNPNGFETVTIDAVSSNGPIQNLGDIGKLNLTVMVAKDMTSQFIVSNVQYKDAAGTTICYVVTDTLPGTFIPQDLCGDVSIRNWMNGISPTRIVTLTPNPVGENESPVLTYEVLTDNTPVKVEVFNLLGENVRTIKPMTETSKGRYNLPIGTLGLQSGTYTVRLSTPATTLSSQFILHK
jgi:hypothetical protein